MFGSMEDPPGKSFPDRKWVSPSKRTGVHLTILVLVVCAVLLFGWLGVLFCIASLVFELVVYTIKFKPRKGHRR